MVSGELVLELCATVFGVLGHFETGWLGKVPKEGRGQEAFDMHAHVACVRLGFLFVL